MEPKNKFRNHMSIIFEKLAAVLGAIIAFAIINVENIVDMFKDGSKSELSLSFVIGALIVLVILVITLVYQFMIWSKTYIVINDGSIVIERDTLHKTKNTIGICNISNVNIEQNLFEMFIGTCKVKLDTNSMSTAEETDVQIVLKKNDADKLRRYLIISMQENQSIDNFTTKSVLDQREDKGILQEFENEKGRLCAANNESENDAFLDDTAWTLEVSGREMLVHGFIAIKMGSVIVAIGTLIALISMIALGAKKLMGGESVTGLFFGLLMVGSMWISAMRDLLKGFIKYYNFKIARKDDKLYMRYGLLKKVSYTIPVEKINAVKLKQSLFARLSGFYMAEISNIGMGDDAEEMESFLFPYCRIGTVAIRIRELIPEYDFATDLVYEKQPKSVWLAWIIPSSICTAIIAILVVIGAWYFAEYKTFILFAGAFSILFGIVFLIISYLTDGFRFGKDAVLLVDGFLEKSYCYLPYGKIQFVEYIQNPVARIFGIQKGKIHILASALNRTQQIAYFSSDYQEFLKDKLLTAK